MSQSQPSSTQKTKRGMLARPLDALVFLLPLITFYELTCLTYPERVIAFDLLQRFFQLFGPAGVWAPGVGVIVILLTTHLASRAPWTIRWRYVGLMYVEAGVLAFPLLALNWAVPLGWEGGQASALVSQVALSIGAGIYEELVFRLIFISVLVMVGVDVFGFRRTSVGVFAVLASSLAFAAHHHQPFGMEPFDLTRFAFRTLAGGYLALVFWYRGYGSAAGCHAAYNVALVALDTTGGW